MRVESVTRVFLDPHNDTYSKTEKVFTWAIAIISAIGTLGIAQGICYLINHCYSIQEFNDTQEAIIKIFKREKEETIEISNNLQGATYERRTRLDSQAPYISIRVPQNALLENPNSHLRAFCRTIRAARSSNRECLCPELLVSFLRGSEIAKGSDSGGLSRQFISDLAKGVFEQSSHPYPEIGNKDVRYRAPYTSSLSRPMSDALKNHYNDLGYFFMYCYHSSKQNPYITGEYLSPIFFGLALSFTIEELQQPFLELPLVRKLELANLLLQGLKTCSCDQVSLRKAVEQANLLVLCGDTDLSSSEDLQYIMQDAVDKGSSLISGHFITIKDGKKKFEVRDMTAEKDLLCENILNVLFNFSCNLDEESKQGSINGHKFGGLLIAMHAIAFGMYSYDMKDWNELIDQFKRNSSLSQTISSKAQGEVNRKLMLEMLDNKTYKRLAKEKAAWLRKWIEQGASELELRAFLSFVTGAPSLVRGSRKIEIIDGGESYSLIGSSTCSFQLKISSWESGSDIPVSTYESFVEELIGAMPIRDFNTG